MSTKTRVNITLDKKVKDALDEKGIAKNRQLSSIINQLLQQYLQHESINGISTNQENFIKKEIRQGIAPLHKQMSILQKQMLPLLITNTFHNLKNMTDEDFKNLMNEIPTLFSTIDYENESNPLFILTELDSIIVRKSDTKTDKVETTLKTTQNTKVELDDYEYDDQMI